MMRGEPQRLTVVGTVARVRRFAPAAARAIGRDVRFAARGAMRFELVRATAADVRREWMRSHPHWADRLQTLFEATPEQKAREEQDALTRRGAGERAAATPVVFEGRMDVASVLGGVTLTGLGDGGRDEQDLTEWLCELLGLDHWHGDRVRVRLTVEPLFGPEPAREPEPRS
jgi:hypothetical protein